jgi:uncharacterized protein YsxB (DUF464 family)
MINITFKPETLELEIKGHAGHGKKGEDIVCAAISTLFYTLGEALNQSSNMLENEPVFKDEDGEGILSCSPKKEYGGNIACIYRTILIGLELVATNYPENVTFKVEG